MKSFKQFQTQINELFDNPNKWRIKTSEDDFIVYEAMINGKQLEVVFEMGDNNDSMWYSFFSTDGEMEATDTGDEFVVYATVLDVLKDFVQNNNVSVIEFSAEKTESSGKTSRIRLYDRMIRKLSVEYGFSLTDRDETSAGVIYTLSR